MQMGQRALKMPLLVQLGVMLQPILHHIDVHIQMGGDPKRDGKNTIFILCKDFFL